MWQNQAMAKIGFSEFLGIVGVVIGILLVVLDKTGKMKNPIILIILLGIAATSTLPLAMSNSWVRNAPSPMLKIIRGSLAIFLVGAVFSGLAAWVFSPNAEDEAGRPDFEILGDPELIKATPELKAQFNSEYVFQITIVNKGKHSAINLENRLILVDQQFQAKQPIVSEGSKGNEIPPLNHSTYLAGRNFVGQVAPTFSVFAIKYQDKEAQASKPFFQTWYFKQIGGTAEAPPLHFSETTIQERESILSYLREKLKGFQGEKP